MFDWQQWECEVAIARAQDAGATSIQLYEQAIAAAPNRRDLYWELGLLLLFQERSAEAQTTWLMAVMASEDAEASQQELVSYLQQAAQECERQQQAERAIAIRRQLLELAPDDLDNSLQLLRLFLANPHCSGDDFAALGLADALRDRPQDLPDGGLLLALLNEVCQRFPLHPASLDLAEVSVACAPFAPALADGLVEILAQAAMRVGCFQRQAAIAVRLCELALELDPNHANLLSQLSGFYQDSDQYEKGIATARRYRTLATNLPDAIFAEKLLLRALMTTGGHWAEARIVFSDLERSLAALVAEPPAELTPLQVARLQNSCFFAPYFRDEPTKNRRLQNQVVALCQQAIASHLASRYQRYQTSHQQRRQQWRDRPRPKLRLGYLSYCLTTHSVGWLTRSLIQHHDRDRFEIYLYMVTDTDSFNPVQEWYVSQSDRAFKSTDSYELAEQIHQDEVNILIDLDSLTTDLTCNTLALKPAPVQATWLGWDASGIPTIDYFIADPYVLPEDAQTYYQETLYRLPQTYLAIDGFEVGIPTLRRDALGIPQDAVLYYSVQKGYKRHPETMHLQLQIIKAVPNSYFLIKGSSDTEAMQEAFYQLADEEGVARDRLRFLPVDLTEATHRANLGIADVVLDTYPYNGATTTMETLWMGVPLVTRVGEQFSARNSYTMLQNVGVREGIAWSAEDYLEWGIRFGNDADLRQKVAWQLRQSRQTAPLWNGRQFARDMEKAYLEMWQRYQLSPAD